MTIAKLKYVSTTVLSKKYGVTSKQLFSELVKYGYITPDRKLTPEGLSAGAIYKEMIKDGKTIKYPAWPEDIDLNLTSDNQKYITATKLGKAFDLSAQKINFILSEIGWAKKGDFKKGWVATNQGLKVGAHQSEDPKSGIPFIRWPESLLKNMTLISTIEDLKGTTKQKEAYATSEAVEFRDKFPAKHRATDGHFTRSKSEMLIDNWLYMFEIVHAYERKLPIEEEVYSDFYIPTGKVYIEYWGYENDSKYL
ncbi:MAG: glycerol kinase, partial [Tenericutes bacterium]